MALSVQLLVQGKFDPELLHVPEVRFFNRTLVASVAEGCQYTHDRNCDHQLKYRESFRCAHLHKPDNHNGIEYAQIALPGLSPRQGTLSSGT